jgi:hypothetical protein
VWPFWENYGSPVGKIDQVLVDGISCLILEGFRPKRRGQRELRVIRVAQIGCATYSAKYDAQMKR